MSKSRFHILEKMASFGSEYSLTKQEGALSPLFTASICSHVLFFPQWYEYYPKDYVFFFQAFDENTKFFDNDDNIYKTVDAKIITIKTYSCNNPDAGYCYDFSALIAEDNQGNFHIISVNDC